MSLGGVTSPARPARVDLTGLVYALAAGGQRRVRLLFDTPEQAMAFVASIRANGGFSDRPGLEETEPTDFEPTGALCSVCRSPQFLTPGGASCRNGHGGAPAVEG